MSDNIFQLRALTFIDSLQPQLTQLIGKTDDYIVCKPKEYDAALLIEIAPAMEIHAMINVALKRTAVQLGAAVTERRFGAMFLQHADQGEVREAGRAILAAAGLTENDREGIAILSNKTIRGIEKDHANFFNLTAKNNKIVPGESVLIMETTPAAYLMIACNEALKAANVKLINIEPIGASGRLVMSGPESEIDSAADAALRIIEQLNASLANKSGTQIG